MKLTTRPVRAIALALAATLALGACARDIGSTSYEAKDVGAAATTYRGTIEGVRQVVVKESDTLEGNTTGMVVGGLAGAAAGSRFGGGFGRTVMTGVGALGGAAVGAVAEEEIKRQYAMEYIVRTEDGRLITVVQGLEPRLSPGDRVYVQVPNRGRARVMRY